MVRSLFELSAAAEDVEMGVLHFVLASGSPPCELQRGTSPSSAGKEPSHLRNGRGTGRMRSRLIVSSLVVSLTLLNSFAAGQSPPAADPEAPRAAEGSEAGGVVLVELIVEDSRGRPISDLKPREIAVEQDGVLQTVGSLEYRTPEAYYELRYRPRSGRVGGVLIRVLRGGSHVRGREGPQVKPRWIAPTPAFELPLRAALDASEAPNDFEYEVSVLRFETRQDTLHHSFVAQIPMSGITVARAGNRAQAQLSFLLRVRRDNGDTVHVGSLEQSVDFETPGEEALRAKRIVWSSNLHLKEGRYLVELAAMDRRASKISVRRMPLTVSPWPRGLRVSSLTFLLTAGRLMQGEDEDNPFRLQDAALVPMLRPTWIPGSEGALSLFAIVYPDRDSNEPVGAAIELYREGQLRAKAPLPLPTPGPEGYIRYVGGLRFQSLQHGRYEVRLAVHQGNARVEETEVLEVVPPPRVQ